MTIILGILALLSLVLTLWQWLVAFRFPLHQREESCRASNAREAEVPLGPPVTLLKPLKGLDSETMDCLQSWLGQQHPGEWQILFGVASSDDPVCDAVRNLMALHPNVDAQLVICPDNLGANAKVSTLIQLMRRARHDIIIVSDADVWVPEGFLAQFATPFQDPSLGLLNCFYRLTAGVQRPGALRVGTPATAAPFVQLSTQTSLNLSTVAMRWEAFAVNADFWSQVLQSQSLKPLDFALGAVMATTRAQLEKMGSFESLADYLADDYQLGHRIAENGGHISISTVVVECRNGPMNWKEVWAHQIRWARTIRACQPLPYFASQLHNSTLWPGLWALSRPTATVFAMAGCCLLTRMAAGFYCESKLMRRPDLNSIWLAPLKDLLQTVIWVLAFSGAQIKWRGQKFRIQPGGKLAALRGQKCGPSGK